MQLWSYCNKGQTQTYYYSMVNVVITKKQVLYSRKYTKVYTKLTNLTCLDAECCKWCCNSAISKSASASGAARGAAGLCGWMAHSALRMASQHADPASTTRPPLSRARIQPAASISCKTREKNWLGLRNFSVCDGHSCTRGNNSRDITFVSNLTA